MTLVKEVLEKNINIHREYTSYGGEMGITYYHLNFRKKISMGMGKIM